MKSRYDYENNYENASEEKTTPYQQRIKRPKRSPREAAHYYQLAAEQGDASAQNNLGKCYQYGEGVEKNIKEAVRYYQLAANNGDALAQVNLGLCYKNGEGVEKNFKEAVRYYQLAAEQQNASGQFNLGVCYQYGIGVKRDNDEAIRYYQLAAKQGDPLALNALSPDLTKLTGCPYFANRSTHHSPAFFSPFPSHADSSTRSSNLQDETHHENKWFTHSHKMLT